MSEVEHHVQNVLRSNTSGPFFKFFYEWLKENSFDVLEPPLASWAPDCVARFGPTDASVLALAQEREATAILNERGLMGWARQHLLGLAVLSVYEMVGVRR